MLTLYSYPSLFGCADNNPFGLKVYAFLKLCGLPFRHEHILDVSYAPRAQLPYLTDGVARLGYHVRLIPAQYVRPFVRRAKNDRTDAEAINDAASRPGMPSVAVKTARHQAELIILKHREMLMAQRTQAINALRGHATEFGVVAAKGTAQVQPLLDKLEADLAIPAVARAMFVRIGEHAAELDRQIAVVDADLLTQHNANPVSQMLAEVPGIGPITAITLALGVDPAAFASGRHFAAWLGLTPKEHSTGG